MGTPVYLAAWNSLTPISGEEAAHQYQLLKDVGSERRFDDKVYAFYSWLIASTPKSRHFRKMNWMIAPLGLQHRSVG